LRRASRIYENESEDDLESQINQSVYEDPNVKLRINKDISKITGFVANTIQDYQDWDKV